MKRRRCPRCGQAAECTGWESQVLRDGPIHIGPGIPSGREYSFRCVSCGRAFRVLGTGQLIWSVIVVCGFGACGQSMVRDALAPEHPLWWRTLVIGALCVTAAFVAALQLAWRLHLRRSARELRDE